MEGRFLMGSNEKPMEGNIYSDKSAVVLDWLLREGIKSRELSVRNVSKEAGVSLGSVQRIFGYISFKRNFASRRNKNRQKVFLERPQTPS